jgi:hypothetical protein
MLLLYHMHVNGPYITLNMIYDIVLGQEVLKILLIALGPILEVYENVGPNEVLPEPFG